LSKKSGPAWIKEPSLVNFGQLFHITAMDPKFDVLPPGTQQRPPVQPSRPARGGLFGVLAAAGALLVKFGTPLLIFAKTGGTMLLSIVIYTLAFHWTWQLATGIVFLIFVHEMGHVVAAKWLGMPVSAPLFIPFIGASIMLKQNPRDAWSEALMAYGGPLAGCIGSWICWWIGLQTDQSWLVTVAMFSFIINLFNLIPVPPLDGGRICAAVSPWFWLIGLGLLGASIVYFHAWNSIVIVILVLVMAIPRMRQTLFRPAAPELRAYYATHISNRLTMALMYIGLIAALILGYWNAISYLSGQS
jgi:Zn-dependent protease